jgi:hypothetical protein
MYTIVAAIRETMKTLFFAIALAIGFARSAQARDTSKSLDGLYTVSVVPYGDGDEGELAVDPWLTKMKWRVW